MRDEKLTRFSRYERDGWLAMQSNLDAQDARDTDLLDFMERERVYVPNQVAAMAPKLVEALERIETAPCACIPEEFGEARIWCHGCIAREALASTREEG